MSRLRKTRSPFKLPDVTPGNWRGELLGGCTLNFGQVVQEGPPRQSVEFTYMIMSSVLTMPEPHFTWPGIVMIVTPTPMKTERPDAGHLLRAKDLPTLSLLLEVTRAQFSDMLRMLESKRLKDFHFTVEKGANGSWPIHSWGMTARLA
jgi:hypothetical protein